MSIVGHYDRQTALYEATVETCDHSHAVISETEERNCARLIDEVQQGGKNKVLYSETTGFWIEEKE